MLKDTPQEWQVTATATPFTGKKTGVRTDEVVMPDGRTARRDYQVHPGSVAVLALDDEERVLVLRQYRHPVRHKLWEIPAGLLDIPGENPLHAAQRELYEEAHVKAERLAGPHRHLHHARRLATRRSGSSSPAASPRRRASASRSPRRRPTWRYARVPLADLVRGALAGELHNNCLVVGVLALHAALAGDGLGRAAPGRRALAGPPVHRVTARGPTPAATRSRGCRRGRLRGPGYGGRRRRLRLVAVAADGGTVADTATRTDPAGSVARDGPVPPTRDASRAAPRSCGDAGRCGAAAAGTAGWSCPRPWSGAARRPPYSPGGTGNWPSCARTSTGRGSARGAAAGGRGRVLLVAGRPGTGRTALAAAARPPRWRGAIPTAGSSSG